MRTGLEFDLSEKFCEEFQLPDKQLPEFPVIGAVGLSVNEACATVGLAVSLLGGRLVGS